MKMAYLYLIVFLSTLQLLAKPSAVTYRDHGGRLGDFLICYTNARWISYKCNLKFLYTPFREANSNKFVLHELNRAINFDMEAKEFAKVKDFELKDMDSESDLISDENTLYVIPFALYNFFLYDSVPFNRSKFYIDWNDEQFMSILRNEIASLEPVPLLELPKDRHLVAVHVRTGIDYDRVPEENIIGCNSCTIRFEDQPDKLWPFKFPHLSYYIEQIERLSVILNNEPLYVHIFTDSPNPEKIAKLFKAYLNKPNIEFGFRSEGNKDSINVVEDFFALGQFSYLIHALSAFSMMASRLFNYKITIYPTFRTEKKDNRIIIPEVVTRINSPKGREEKKSPAGLNFDWEKFCEITKSIRLNSAKI